MAFRRHSRGSFHGKFHGKSHGRFQKGGRHKFKRLRHYGSSRGGIRL
nr:MAG: hypothetical protein [Microviridae sp.]